MFKKVKQNRISQDVVNQIQEVILQGKLKAGDKLPAERELSEIFNASRGSLREALRILEQKGLITVKPGASGGVFVKAVTTQAVSESLDLLMRYQKVSLKDLVEFREGVEGIVAELAAERVKKEDIPYLKSLLREAEISIKEGIFQWGKFIQLDSQLHMALAHIVGNPVYESVLRTVYDNIHPYDRFLPKDKELLREYYQDLCEIVKAVEKGQAKKARLLARKHINRSRRFVEKKKK